MRSIADFCHDRTFIASEDHAEFELSAPEVWLKIDGGPEFAFGAVEAGMRAWAGPALPRRRT